MNELDPALVIIALALAMAAIFALLFMPREPKRCKTCAAPAWITCEFCHLRRRW